MNGHLTSITLNTGGTIWALGKLNPRMLPTKVRLGRLNQSLSYDVYGRVTGREVTDREHEDLQYLQYYYNMSTGNMTLRWDHVNGTDETFSYDALNRLTALSQNVTKEPSPCHSYRFFEATPSKSLLKLSYIENYSIILYLGNMADILVYIFEHYKITTI